MTRPHRAALGALVLAGALLVPIATAAATTKKPVTTKRATPKPSAKPVKRSLSAFCAATKAWTAWETATLNQSGNLNEKWVTDTLAYARPISQSAPNEIKEPVWSTLVELVVSRRRIVESIDGTLNMPDAVEVLVGTGEKFAADTNVSSNRDTFAAYSAAKCNVDWTAPFKALGSG